ncbi:F-box protein PP2-B10-like [Papaver somniferum]|uniref:F-box protein PP2-B10-like n=1 Tax=Papaver somniferum TaxID=3469 RepID=UPI000E702E5E|nr:F-box protein PP2-B10-like [Papaver somniferum]
MERAEREEEVERSDINNLERLPEGFISDILALTTPADACRSSLVSTVFKSAADSDVVWEKFLPADYQDIITRTLHPFPSAAAAPSKKELYYRLCNDPLLIDGGSKSFQLEKSSGKKCIMLGANDLAIAWGNTPQYWENLRRYSSRFAKVAELLHVCWLEIHGNLEIQLLSPNTLYVAYLVLQIQYNAFGFDNLPIKAKVEVFGGNTSVCSEERFIYLCPPDPMMEAQYFARGRGDGWMEVEIGHFYNGGGDNEGGEVHMSVIETEKVKGGLIVQAANFVRRIFVAGYNGVLSMPRSSTANLEFY